MTVEEIRSNIQKRCEKCFRNTKRVSQENRCLWHNANREELCPYANLWGKKNVK